MRRGALAALLAAMVCALLPAAFGQTPAGQRRVSAVKNTQAQSVNENRERQDSIARAARLVHYHDEQGNVIVVDTVTGQEWHDTTAVNTSPLPKMIQPTIFAATVGLDFWDPIMRAFGQKYGLFEVSGELNIHNRYLPVVEIGLGTANNRPADGNFTFHVPVTPYFRVGCNYNFLYNSNPDYMFYAGLRLGYSRFTYELNDVTIAPGYWGPGQTFNFPHIKGSLTYMQFLLGLRVRLGGPFSMGWAFRFKAKLNEKKSPYGQPWYIPGYGSRKGAIAGSFSLFYTFSLGPNLLPPPPPPVQ